MNPPAIPTPLTIKIEDHLPFSPALQEPSFKFPPSPTQPKLTERGRRSAPSESHPRRAHSRRRDTPYSATSMSSRTRRTRPEPTQLFALKKLYNINPSPSIEERTTLALEIGMDVSKVTNYFRNQRQSTRKKKSNARSDEEYTDGGSTSTSRACTPSLVIRRRGSRRITAGTHSSDDEEQEEGEEAVTPPPLSTPQIWIADALHEARTLMAVQECDPGLAADALLLLEFQATCQY